MARSRRLGSIVGWVVVLGFVVGAGAPPPTAAAGTTLPAWNGGVDLYRSGTFTTQKSWLWCTAAGVQIVDNIVDRRKDHTTAGQRRYFDWMRKHNRYSLPVSAGVDPAGWTAGLRHFVDDRYRLVSSRTFDEALRSAVTRMRQTGLPVAITVSHGGHGWILTGFRATADPARTTAFKVTSVRVVGPLYGLQSTNGYDMPPNTKLTPAQLRRYFTPWKYAPKPMVWDGRYVSIQPVSTLVKATATAAPTKPASPRPTPTVPASPAAASQSTTLPSPAIGPSGPLTAAIATDTRPSEAPGDRSAATKAVNGATTPPLATIGVLGAASVVLAMIVLGLTLRRRRSTR